MYFSTVISLIVLPLHDLTRVCFNIHLILLRRSFTGGGCGEFAHSAAGIGREAHPKASALRWKGAIELKKGRSTWMDTSVDGRGCKTV
jgi:hypothetical protein